MPQSAEGETGRFAHLHNLVRSLPATFSPTHSQKPTSETSSDGYTQIPCLCSVCSSSATLNRASKHEHDAVDKLRGCPVTC